MSFTRIRRENADDRYRFSIFKLHYSEANRGFSSRNQIHTRHDSNPTGFCGGLEIVESPKKKSHRGLFYINVVK